MHAFDPRHPQSRAPHFRWSPAQLADAVPLRLSELIAFAIDPENTSATPRRTHNAGYLPAETLAPRFRIS